MDDEGGRREGEAVRGGVEVMLGRVMICRGFLLSIAFALTACSCSVSDLKEGRCTEGMIRGLWLRPSFSLRSSIAFLFFRLRFRLAVSELAVLEVALEGLICSGCGAGEEVSVRGVAVLGRMSCERRV